MSELKELIDLYLEIEQEYDGENQEQEKELGELGHQIDHAVFNHDFVLVFNNSGDEEEVVVLIVDEEKDEFVIPVFTDMDEAQKAISFFKEESGDVEFTTDTANGDAVVQAYSEDDGFLGLAINAPQYDFVVFGENVHDCCE